MQNGTALKFEETGLSTHGGRLTVGQLIERLRRFGYDTPVRVCVDGFNFAELDANSVLDGGDFALIGIAHGVAREGEG